MSGFDGRIVFEGDTARGKQLLGLAIKLASVQHQNKNILGLTSSTKSYDLGGGAYCVVVDIANMRAMRIVAPVFNAGDYAFDEEITQSRAGPGVYSVLAGYTSDPTIEVVTLTDPQGNKRQVDAIRHFVPTNRTKKRHPNDLYRRQRLAVEENSIFAPLVPSVGEDVRWTEHAHIKPSNYTGLMRQAVQLILGLGKIIRPTAEEAMKLDPLPLLGTDWLTKKSKPMTSAFGLYNATAKAAVPRVDFDYRVSKTHGVTVDDDAIMWVIEIGMRGVHAMRLYMDPISTTTEGMKRWIEVNPELEDFIATFKGIPLGLTLPTFELFDKFKRAGEVVELISSTAMRDFYSKAPMSSDTGWCFSPYGTEAHNTCWDYGIDEVKRGYHFGISINLTHERFEDWSTARRELASKFVTGYEVNKCRRMTEGQARTILTEYFKGPKEGYKLFDETVVKPTLVGHASMSLQKSGKLYHPAKFIAQPQIKFPEQLLDAELSFDFGDASEPRKFRRVKCDTPMYVCYIQGNLEVINYYFDNSVDAPVQPAEYESTRQECQYVGSWVDTSIAEGPDVVEGNFYSNRWDFRQEIRQAYTSITKHQATRITAWPSFGQEFLLSTVVYAWTTVACWDEAVSTELMRPPQWVISVGIPQYDRCAYYFGTLEQISDRRISHSGNAITAGTKQKDEWSIYHYLMAWVGGPHCPENEWIDKGPIECFARKRCIWIDDEACFDDNLHQGFFWNLCTTHFNTPDWPTPELPSSYTEGGLDDPGEANATVYFVNDTPHGETITKQLRETYIHGTSWSVWWERASPDEVGSMPALRAVNSCLGEPVTNMMDEFNGVIKHLGGPEYMRASWHSCYTGVIE